MGAIDKFKTAQIRQNNEYYTKYDDIAYYVENTSIGDYFNNKIIYLPCDTEESNIYKYLVNNKEKYNIKEIINTADDYYGHEDLYDRADIVFTNPPFTGLRKWMRWLKENNRKFILWYPVMQSLSPMDLHDNFIIMHDGGGRRIVCGSKIMYREKGYLNFMTPDGDKGVAVYIISNDDYFADKNMTWVGHAFEKTFEDVKDKLYMQPDGYYECGGTKYIPSDYYEPIWITTTAYYFNRSAYEYIKFDRIRDKNGHLHSRYLVRIKPQNGLSV